MTYILDPERDIDPIGAFARYREYLRQREAQFPPNAFALATSDWYGAFTDHRAPHDGWLRRASFEESERGDRREIRRLALRLTLLGAYHDLELEFFYPQVFAYRFEGDGVERGQGDWLYDEFRLADNGHLLHEIQWRGVPTGSRGTWLIESDDVVFTYRDAPPPLS
jgi:hypothetical protein